MDRNQLGCRIAQPDSSEAQSSSKVELKFGKFDCNNSTLVSRCLYTCGEIWNMSSEADVVMSDTMIRTLLRGTKCT